MLADMAAPSPPIDIVSPSRLSSSSPRNQSSNLTTALQNAAQGVDIPSAGQPRPVPMRHESHGLGIPSGKSFSQSANRRESNTGSYNPQLSWGGMSISQWLDDDTKMTGMSPLNTAMQSPSLHSSSYLPKMEANFWSNLRCCDIGFNDLHDLLQHYEEAHASAQPSFPHRMSLGRSFRRKSSFMSSVGQGAPAANQIRGFQPFTADNDMGAGFSRGPNTTTNDLMRPSLSAGHDMDTIGEMEMDEPSDSFLSPEPSAAFTSGRPSPINPTLANVVHAERTAQSSPSTPTTARQTNPMVSSVNTPTFPSTARTSPSNGMPTTTTSAFNPQLLSSINNDMSHLDFSDGPNGDMTDLCINNPARALYSENGALNPQQALQFGFANGANGNSHRPLDPNASPRLAAARAMLPPEDDRPYRCKVIGCEKAYKNSNGLRYHERHGHSGQKLRDNDDGSKSIVDPETNEPYPGTLGMEKEKPYSCDVCCKRYKNLNGLKYHRNHSAPCNPEINGGLATLSLSQPAQPNMGLATGAEPVF